MTLLRVVGLIAWGLLAGYMAPAAWSALFARVKRRGDAMRLGVFATCILIIGYNVRALVAPENDGWLQALHVLSIGTALGIFWLARSYGRGPVVYDRDDDA